MKCPLVDEMLAWSVESTLLCVQVPHSHGIKPPSPQIAVALTYLVNTSPALR